MLGRINLLKSFLARCSAPLSGIIISVLSNKISIITLFLILSGIMGFSATIFYLKNYKTFNNEEHIINDLI